MSNLMQDTPMCHCLSVFPGFIAGMMRCRRGLGAYCGRGAAVTVIVVVIVVVAVIAGMLPASIEPAVVPRIV